MEHADIDPVNEIVAVQCEVLRHQGNPGPVAIRWEVAQAAVGELLEARMRTGSALSVFCVGSVSGAVSASILWWLFG